MGSFLVHIYPRPTPAIVEEVANAYLYKAAVQANAIALYIFWLDGTDHIESCPITANAMDIFG